MSINLFINLASGRGLDKQVITTLQTILTDLDNVRGSGAMGEDRRRSYLAWATTAANMLRGVVTSDERAHLVLTDRYRILLDVGLGDREMNALVDLELDDRRTVWQALLAAATAWRARWADAGVVVVVDTNIFLHHEQLFTAIDWHKIMSSHTSADGVVRVVVPLLVIDELDKNKRNNRPATQVRARATLREFDALLANGNQEVDLQPAPRRVTFDVLVDDLDHVRLSDNDSELIACTRLLADLVHPAPLWLVTADTGMAVRAQAIGLTVHKLTFDHDGQRQPR